MIYQIHPLCEVFPELNDEDFLVLKSDIEKYGVLEHGILFEGKVLDGRHRYRACRELGINMPFLEIDDDDKDFDAAAFVISKNLHRRHLSETQRAMVAARIANLGKGRPEIKVSIDTFKIDDVAKQFSVSPISVKRAKKVLQSGTKELIDDCDRDRVTVSKAAKAVKQTADPAEQVKIARSKERQQIKDVESQERDAIDSWVRRFAGFENKFLAVKELLKVMDGQVKNAARLLLEATDGEE